MLNHLLHQVKINALQSDVPALRESISAAYNEINRLKNNVEIIDRQEMANKATTKEIDERLSKIEDYLKNDEKLMWPRIYTIVAAVIIFLAFGLAIGLLK